VGFGGSKETLLGALDLGKVDSVVQAGDGSAGRFDRRVSPVSGEAGRPPARTL
jgi:hypothetical protein